MFLAPSLPLLQLTPRPDLGILVGRWGFQPEPTLLPTAYEQLAEAALRDDCHFWLQDIRRRTSNDPNTTTWLLAEYFPSMATRLKARLSVAYLVGPDLHRHIVNGPDFVPVELYNDKPFTIGLFGDEGQAIRWLQEQQAAE
ncbi:hypothetical protein [Hymenobacter sp. B1770]|uniref:hypothetical protein n=1 Tax=Hymenobacter sp. B1770 TaxID=1718788 RepID=UPI003CF98FDE